MIAYEARLGHVPHQPSAGKAGGDAMGVDRRSVKEKNVNESS
jgi:hypothetical protein